MRSLRLHRWRLRGPRYGGDNLHCPQRTGARPEGRQPYREARVIFLYLLLALGFVQVVTIFYVAFYTD